MEFELRHQLVGAATALVAFVAYWAIIIVRASTDGLPFTHVAWRGPLLLVLGLGGALYGIGYGVARWRVRGRTVLDARDAEIQRVAESTGAGLTSLAVLVALLMFGFHAPAFWVAHVLFVGSFLGALAQSGTAIAAYREGLQS